MKGGGFLILLFLLICFLWGVTSVVGRITQAFKPQRNNKPDSKSVVEVKTKQVNQPEPHSTAEISPTPEASQPSSPRLNETLEQLERLHKLHQDGVLTAVEFAQMKAKLLVEQEGNKVSSFSSHAHD